MMDPVKLIDLVQVKLRFLHQKLESFPNDVPQRDVLLAEVASIQQDAAALAALIKVNP